MSINACGCGKKAPNEINVIVEVPGNSAPVKYEIDKDNGILKVDRVLFTPMFYPCNYGFMPNTLCGDGDPLDVLVVSEYPFVPKSMVVCRPVGVLMMEDEAGQDEKIIAVPINKVSKVYENVNSYTDLPDIKVQQIKHFFEHYKDLEPNKWVKVTEVKDAEFAKEVIKNSMQAFLKD